MLLFVLFVFSSLVNDCFRICGRDDAFNIFHYLVVFHDRFAETPGTKRGIESPSAWKSPWFVHSFVSGQRFDTELTFEVLHNAVQSL